MVEDDPKNKDETWLYKKDHSVREKMWRVVEQGPWRAAGCAPTEAPQSDDELDSRVAYLLGRLWLSGGQVMQLGDKDSGAFLLPTVEKLGLKEAWDHHKKSLSW